MTRTRSAIHHKHAIRVVKFIGKGEAQHGTLLHPAARNHPCDDRWRNHIDADVGKGAGDLITLSPTLTFAKEIIDDISGILGMSIR